MIPNDSEEDNGYINLCFVVNESLSCFFNHSQFNDEILDENTSYFQLDCWIEKNSKSFTIKLSYITHIYVMSTGQQITTRIDHLEFCQRLFVPNDNFSMKYIL